MLENQTVFIITDFYCMDKKNISKYLILWYTEESQSYRVGTTWGWVNDLNFQLNYPFNCGIVLLAVC